VWHDPDVADDIASSIVDVGEDASDGSHRLGVLRTLTSSVWGTSSEL
tara:strand:+ start:190 stop:330 length:141 start_codon:yes stop_codon:yes gene_type:complete